MRKTLNIIANIIMRLFTVAVVCLMIFVFISLTFVNKNERGLFGYKFFIVLSDSMSATDFDAGDLIITKKVDDPTVLAEGDIITFISQNPESFGAIITHKIRSVTTDPYGEPGFVTYGTTTNTDDATIVTYPYLLGQYQGNIPYVGNVISFMKTTPGYICCILIPFLLIIFYQAMKVINSFRAYKAEQEEERMSKIIDREKAERETMQAQIDELKKQLMETQNALDERK